MPRASTLLAWADVRVGFPSALMRVVAPMAFFCSIHSFLCKCGDCMERLDMHLTSEGCNTFSMAKTSGKAQCAPYYKNTITYSTSVYYYYKSLPSKSLTITFMWRLPILRDAPWRISILISIITILLLLLLLLFLLLLQEPTDIPSRKKLMKWVCARGLVCQKREFTVRSSSCEVMIRS